MNVYIMSALFYGCGWGCHGSVPVNLSAYFVLIDTCTDLDTGLHGKDHTMNRTVSVLMSWFKPSVSK